MKRDDFITFLIENSCKIVRTDRKGYSVVRNPATGGQSGVPVDDPLRPMTICVICRNLKLDALPDEPEIYRAKVAIDKIQADLVAKDK